MANPNYDQRRREEANVGGMHESSDTEHESWTHRDHGSGHSDSGQQGQSDQHHHHHHHHHGGDSPQSDSDYERLAEKARNRVQNIVGDDESGRSSQHGGIGSQQGHNFGEEHGHTDRRGSRGANDPGSSRSPRTGGHESGGHGGQHGMDRSQSSHRDQGRQHSGQSDRRYGSRRKQRATESHSHGSPHGGSQRGSDREEGLSGRMMGQRGESTHHSDPSESNFRDRTMGQREHRHGGERGTSERDRRFGSRRGHGSERHTDERHSSQ